MTKTLSELAEIMDILEKILKSDASDAIKTRAQQIRKPIHEAILERILKEVESEPTWQRFLRSL